MIEIKHVTKSFATAGGQVDALKDVTLTIPDGDIYGIIGMSGAGKSTLVRCINLLERPTEGQVLIDGTDITHQREHKLYTRIGRIFQNPAMGTCPDMTMLENLSLADNKGKPFGLSRGVNRKRVEYYREKLAELKLGLEDKLDVKMGALSGGQRQAVALLMTTLSPLDFLILDEHTAALDPRTAEIIMELTDKIVRQQKLTAMMVTHNLRHAVEYGDRLLMMHQGHVIMDKAGDEKRALKVDDLLDVFTSISIECGN